MKAFLSHALALALALVSISAFADPGPHNEELKAQMKAMNANFKAIQAGATNPALYPALAAKADEIITQAQGAEAMLPTTVTELPEPQRSERKALYEKLIGDLTGVATQLSVALKAGDKAAVAKAIEDMKASRSEGHDQFRRKEE